MANGVDVIEIRVVSDRSTSICHAPGWGAPFFNCAESALVVYQTNGFMDVIWRASQHISYWKEIGLRLESTNIFIWMFPLCGDFRFKVPFADGNFKIFETPWGYCRKQLGSWIWLPRSSFQWFETKNTKPSFTEFWYCWILIARCDMDAR